MSDELLWVAWIPVGKGQVQDEGAVVGTQFVCERKAEEWLRADPEHIRVVKIAPIPSRNIADARLELGEPALSVELDF